MQRCQVHKLRTILDHVQQRECPVTQAVVRRAYQTADVKTATRLLITRVRSATRAKASRRRSR